MFKGGTSPAARKTRELLGTPLWISHFPFLLLLQWCLALKLSTLSGAFQQDMILLKLDTNKSFFSHFNICSCYSHLFSSNKNTTFLSSNSSYMMKFQSTRNICIASYKKRSSTQKLEMYQISLQLRHKPTKGVNWRKALIIYIAKYFSPLIKRIPLRLSLNCEYPLTYL